MNYLFLIICSILLSGHISSIKITPNKPKLCVDCKHYTKDFFNNKYGKCSLFTTEDDNKAFLVDGIDRTRIEYQYCSIARKYAHMCGEEGKLYVKNTGIKK